MILHAPDNLEPVDQLLADHLAATLEPQRGKAEAAFRAHLAGAGTRAAMAPESQAMTHGGSGQQISRKAFFLWSTLPPLLAACLAVAVTLQFVRPPALPAPVDNPGVVAGVKLPPAGGGTIVVNAPTVEQTVITRDAPGGVVVNNNTPMRVIHREEIRQTRWVDPQDQSVYVVTEPVSRVDYVEVEPF